MTQDERILNVLAEFDDRQEPITESSVGSALGKLADEIREPDGSVSEMLCAEHLAFGFQENCQDREGTWRTYYGPFAVGQNEQGERVEVPSISDVTPERIAYWRERALEAKHPVLRARYAGLVCDFSKRVTGNEAPSEFARITIDADLETVLERRHKHRSISPTRLRRALHLAQRFADAERMDRVRSVVLDSNREGNWYNWSPLLDDLVDNPAFGLTSEEESRLLASVEREWESLCVPDSADSFRLEGLTHWLATYQQKRRKRNEVRRVLLKYGKTVEEAAATKKGFAAASALEQLRDLYKDFGLRHAATNLMPALTQAYAQSCGELRTVSTSFEVPREEMDSYIAAITDGDLFCVLSRIALHFVEDEKEARKRVLELSKVAVLTYVARQQVIDYDGVPIVQLDSIENDLKGRTIRHMYECMQFNAPLLRTVMQCAIQKFELDTAQLVDHLYKSPIFDPHQRRFLKVGIDAYLRGDFLIVSHVLYPQIERAVRNLVHLSGGVVLEPGKYGGTKRKGLSALLWDPVVFRALGEKNMVYLRTLLTDPRGRNLRNRVAHGIAIPDELEAGSADRIVHALLLLALLRANQEEPSGPSHDKHTDIGGQS